MLRRHGEIVHETWLGQLDKRGIAHAAVGAQMPNDAAFAEHAEVPHLAVRSALGMGGERRAVERACEGLAAARVERSRVDAPGRAAFPQRPDLARDGEHAGVRGVDVVDAAQFAGRLRREAIAGIEEATGGMLVAPFVGRDEAAAMAHATAADREALDHAVAVEPVTEPLARAFELRGADAIECALKLGWEAAFDQRRGRCRASRAAS